MTQRQKRWAWAGLALLTLLVLVALAGHASVLGWVLQRAGVQATGLSGSVWGGLSVAQLRHGAPGWTLEADGVQLAPVRWQAGALQTQVRAASVRVQSRPHTSSTPPLTAAQLLQALDWPTPLRLTQIDIEQLQLDGVAMQALRASLAAGGAPEALQLTLHRLRLPQADLQVSAELQLQPSGQLRLQAQALRAGTTPLDARLSAEGSLDQLPVTLALQAAEGAKAQLSVTLQPLAAQPLRGLEGRFSGLNTRALHPDAPTSAWDGHLSLRTRKPTEPGLPWAVELQARNAQALRLDEGGWPLRALAVQLELDPAQWQALKLQQLQVDLGRHSSSAGTLSVVPLTTLPHTGQALLLPLQLRLSDLRLLHQAWPSLGLTGQLTLRQPRLDTQAPLQFSTDVQARALQPSALLSAWRLQAQGSAAGQRVSLDNAELTQTAGPGTASLRGQWQAGSAPGRWQAEATLNVQGWPLAVAPWTRPGRLHASATLALQQGPSQLTGSAALQLVDGNQWAGLPLTGQVGWKATPTGAQWQAQLAVPAEAADNAAPPQLSLSASGSRPAPPRQAAELAEPSAWSVQQLRWQAPQLARLKPWWQPWLPQLAGSTEGEAELQGNAAQPSLQALRAQLKQLQLQLPDQAGSWTLTEASASWAASAGRLQLKGLQGAGWLLDTAEAQGGSAQAWAWRAEGHAPPAAPGEPKRPWRLEGQTAAPLHSAGDGRWTWPVLQLSVGPPGRNAAPWLSLSDTSFDASPSSAALRGGQLRLWGEALRITQADLAWPQGWPTRRLNVALDGSVRPASWLAAADPTSAWSGDLQTDLQLRLRQTGTQDPELSLQGARTQGELRQGDTALGLNALRLNLQRSSTGALQAEFDLQSSVLGNSHLSARTGAGGLNLTGRLQAELGALRPLRPWLPAGLELRGKAKLAATLSGSLAAPHLVGQGDMQIERLQHAASGLGGRNGSVSLGFGENSLRLTQFQLQGLGDQDDGGWLKGEGELSWGGSGSASTRNPTGSLRVQAQAFRLLNRFDRQLVTTGQAELGFTSQRLKLHGQFSADRGLLDISQGDAPSLDDDVSVHRSGDKAAAEARKTPTVQRDIDLRFNLGQALRLQGRGLASRLMGELRFVDKTGPGSSANYTAQTTGKIELGGGRYKAYGQTLDIESGELRFTGALDNPRLDILALRPDIEARVGVQVTGSAQTPRVRLYSEPDMPDNDKLAWLLLGRAPEELGRNDTALLQRAALALVAGEGENPAAQLMDKLGLTEFSVNNSEDAGTTLRLGAQLGRRWSVAYERSLNSATGSWQLVYRAGQRLRLRAQSGTDSAIDALWLWRYDKL